MRKSWRLPAYLGLLSAFTFPFVIWTGLNAWGEWYDDAFITYRYSDNLARGLGLVWNAGEPPTEGFTSLLHVLMIAPFLTTGALDALSVARALNLVFLVGAAVLLYRTATGPTRADKAAAVTVTAIFVLVPASIQLVMVGLETLPFTFMLLLSVILSAKAFGPHGRSPLFTVALGATWIGTGLMRPEGLLVVIAAWLFLAFRALRRRQTSPRPLLLATSVAAVLGVLYLLWKFWWFGELLPNPFFIKSSGIGLSPLGVASVTSFVSLFGGLVAVALVSLSLLLAGRIHLMGNGEEERGPLVQIAAITSGLFLIFYLRTDTLMDIQGRFLFPILPLVIVTASPLLALVFRQLLRVPSRLIPLSLVSVFAVLIALTSINWTNIPQAINVLAYPSVWQREQEEIEANVQRKIAMELAEYPNIESVRIAYGDAGVIPFFTRSLWLDPVGLNDSFLARSQDRASSIDYFFEQEPDLVIQPVTTAGDPIDFGHGLLGNYASWADDERWAAYRSVGTLSRNDAPYFLEFRVRSDSVQADELAEFVTNRLAVVAE